MPKLGEQIDIQNATNSPGIARYTANETWSGFNVVDRTAGYMNLTDVRYLYVSPDMSDYQIFDYPKGTDGKHARKLMLANDYLGFTCFSLKSDIGSPGAEQIAVYIKPMGIDKVWLPYFDNTKYDMELVWGVNADRQPDDFVKVPWDDFLSSATGGSVHPNTGLCLTKNYFMPYHSRFNANLIHAKGSNRFRTYFRFRDKVTKKVGRLSSAHIELLVNQTNAPVKLMVLQD